MGAEEYESLPTNNVVTHMTAGAIAGVMEHCVMYPLDSVKTRMQSLATTTGQETVKGTLLRMVKQEGMFRPVRGMSAMVVGAGPSHALYFSSYEYLKKKLIAYIPNTPRFHPLVYGIAGCLSTVVHDACMNPAEVVKQRMQMQNSQYKSVLRCFRDIYSKEGPRAFYRSYTTSLAMNIPFQCIHFVVYEGGQLTLNPGKQYNPVAHVVSGALAGGFAAAVTTPLDVCKTLLNTQNAGGFTSGMVQAVKKVYAIGGPRGYFRGLQARVMFQMPAAAICWSTYEFFKYFLATSNDVILVNSATVLAETESQYHAEELIPPAATTHKANTPPNEKNEKINIKPRELPAMSGAGLYGSISFNTMHTADSSCRNNRKDSILDIVHT